MVLTGSKSGREGYDRNDVLLKATTGLRLEGTDVTLALSHHEEDMIQISSDLLKATSDYFKTGLSSRWISQRPKVMTVDEAEDIPTTQSYRLTMDSQRDGYTLVRGVCLYHPKLAI